VKLLQLNVHNSVLFDDDTTSLFWPPYGIGQPLDSCPVISSFPLLNDRPMEKGSPLHFYPVISFYLYIFYFSSSSSSSSSSPNLSGRTLDV